jgi:hypothetical protein
LPAFFSCLVYSNRDRLDSRRRGQAARAAAVPSRASLNSTRAAWLSSGSPSAPAGFALATTRRGFNTGLLCFLELDVSSQLSVRDRIGLGLTRSGGFEPGR